MADLRYILPERVDAETVERRVGRAVTCPYCQAQKTTMKGNLDTEWVQTPLRQLEPKWVCLGCCIDIYSTCLSPEFESHPYRDIVEEAARKEGLTETAARKLCLSHQKSILEQRCPDGDFGPYEAVYARLCDQLGELP